MEVGVVVIVGLKVGVKVGVAEPVGVWGGVERIVTGVQVLVAVEVNGGL